MPTSLLITRSKNLRQARPSLFYSSWGFITYRYFLNQSTVSSIARCRCLGSVKRWSAPSMIWISFGAPKLWNISQAWSTGTSSSFSPWTTKQFETFGNKGRSRCFGRSLKKGSAGRGWPSAPLFDLRSSKWKGVAQITTALISLSIEALMRET